MRELKIQGQPGVGVLDAIPNLVAVGRGKDFEGPIRQADLYELPAGRALHEEWRATMRR